MMKERKDWSDGPWQHEQDWYEFQAHSPAGQLPCRIIRHMTIGHLCGYVGIPPDHVLHGVEYSRLENDLECHGGLTYSGTMKNLVLPEEGNPRLEACWWIGFDCGHLGDFSPGMASFFSFHDGVYRTADYVREQCVQLAAQVLQVRSLPALPMPENSGTDSFDDSFDDDSRNLEDGRDD